MQFSNFSIRVSAFKFLCSVLLPLLSSWFITQQCCTLHISYHQDQCPAPEFAEIANLFRTLSPYLISFQCKAGCQNYPFYGDLIFDAPGYFQKYSAFCTEMKNKSCHRRICCDAGGRVHFLRIIEDRQKMREILEMMFCHI